MCFEPGELNAKKTELQGLQNRLYQLNKKFTWMHISEQPADEDFKKLVQERRELRKQFTACERNYNSLRYSWRVEHDRSFALFVAGSSA